VSRSWLLLILAVAACEQRPRDVAVRVSIPGPDSVAAPVAGIGLVALPYDRDSVLRALEAAARSPRPSTTQLDSLFQQFRGPFSDYASASFAADKLRSTLAALKHRLDSLPRNAPEYRDLYTRFAQQSAALAAAEKRETAARIALADARTKFVGRSDSLRTRIRLWEDSTYQGYDSIVRGLASARRRQPVADTTGADGWAHLRLEGGPWWIYARSWDATDPNAEWYWNVPVTADTLQLTPAAGARRPKY
jgi:hypothetical protein